MSQYYNPNRSRRLYDPNSKESYLLIPEEIEIVHSASNINFSKTF